MKKIILLIIPVLCFFSCENENETNDPLASLNEVGYFHADGDFYKTTDSGQNWNLQGNSGVGDVDGMSFVN